jgi:hypothetical protein
MNTSAILHLSFLLLGLLEEHYAKHNRHDGKYTQHNDVDIARL